MIFRSRNLKWPGHGGIRNAKCQYENRIDRDLLKDERIILKRILKKYVVRCGLDSDCSGLAPVAGYCE
jgi:hypothetical protein